MDLRRLSYNHKSFGDDPKPVRRFGIEVEDVRAPDRARTVLDGAKLVWAASSLGVITVVGHKVWSFHLDVKPFAQAQGIHR